MPRKIPTRCTAIHPSANGEGILKFGETPFACLGKIRLSYPKDLTEGEGCTDSFPVCHSMEFDVAMYFSIKIWAQRGIFIHAGADTLEMNGGGSKVCIHRASGNAKMFYDWVTGPTRILITYDW